MALSEGDTIPSGAMVRFRLRGEDRVRSTTDTDSFCCDEQLDSAAPRLSFHAMTDFVARIRRVRDSLLYTLFGPIPADSVLTMNVGPFDYPRGLPRAATNMVGAAKPSVFDFIAGYPPRLPEPAIEEGSRALLSPERDPDPGEIPFVRGSQATMGWDPTLNDWLDDRV